MDKIIYKCVAKTIAGLEGVLAQELEALGISEYTTLNRAIAFDADQEQLYKANLWLRTAMRILVEQFQFRFRTVREFYDAIYDHPWEEMMSYENTLSINAIIANSDLFRHSQFTALKTKDAIVDRLRDKQGKRPSIDRADPDFNINIKINRDHCICSLNSSGQPLFKRGYRNTTAQAPINEILAAGLVYLSGWDKTSPLYDPFCGSATIPIEAGMIAQNIPPAGLRQTFGFMHWKDYDMSLWKSIKEQSIEQKVYTRTKIYASDIDGKIVRESRDNVVRSGNSLIIQLSKRDFFQTNKLQTPGMLITNPPYDMRLKLDDTMAFYAQIGDTLKKYFIGSQAWILTANAQAMKSVGLKTSQKISVQNGPLPCKFLNYHIYKGTKKIHKTLAQ